MRSKMEVKMSLKSEKWKVKLHWGGSFDCSREISFFTFQLNNDPL
jgi:hypothetical protein